MCVRSKVYSFAAFLAFASLCLGFSASAETFRLGHHQPVGGIFDQAAHRFADSVKEQTQGRVEVQIFPAAQLGQEREAYDLLSQGAIDMTLTSAGFLAKDFPPMAVTGLPFIFRSWDHAKSALRGEFGTELAKGVREAGNVEVLAYLGGGFRDMLFRGEPITETAGMSGIKMRSPEDFVWIRMYELLGAKPTPVTLGEIYTAMQTGVASGLDMPATFTLDLKLYEVTNSLVKTGHMFTPIALAVNKDVFAAFSAEDQEIVRAAALEATDWADTTISIPGQLAAYAELEKKGMTVVDPTNPEQWAATMRPLWDEVAAKAPDNERFIRMLDETQ
jgi:tripartite ATP-independent transporter DctP family solute receptor